MEYWKICTCESIYMDTVIFNLGILESLQFMSEDNKYPNVSTLVGRKAGGGTIPPNLLKNQEGLYSLDFGWTMAIKVSISVELWLLKSRFWPLGHKTILHCKVAYSLKNPGNLFVYLQFNLPIFFTRIYYMYIIIMFHVVSKYLLVSVMIEVKVKVKVITTCISIIGWNKEEAWHIVRVKVFVDYS